MDNDFYAKKPHDLRRFIDRTSLLPFFQVSTVRGVSSVILEWALIIVSAYFCEKYFHWSIYLLSVVFIGARLLALGLIMHEAVHDLVSENKKINDVLGELFCAWPLFISMRSYKVKHLAHHKWLNTDQDPDFVAKTDVNWKYPMFLPRFLKVLLVQLSGVGIFETFKVMSGAAVKTEKPKTPLWYHLSRISFYLIIIGSVIMFGHGMILLKYWIIPFATWTQLANRLRRVAEHSGIQGKELAMQTRTTTHGFFANLLLAPKNISYHAEHHLYPGIPCYNLVKTHKVLFSIKEVENSFYVSKDYTSVFKDCIITNKD